MGTIELFTKPMSGIAGGISKAAEGAASDAKRVQQTGGGTDSAVHVLRVRQPRELSQTGGGPAVLMPYPRAFHMLY